MKNFFKRIDWVNATFLISTPIIAAAGIWYLAAHGGVHWATVGLFLFMTIATGISITAGYHRLFSHKSFDAKWPFRLFVLIFGAAAFENSALNWSSDHRNHHKFVDTDQDPYNINRGFWYAHMGWVMMKYDLKHKYDNVVDLENDPLVRFQNRNYVWMGIVAGFLFPTALASLWGDALGGLFLAGFFRTVMNHHFTFSINSFAHMFGKQPYNDNDTSRDSWYLALFTYGEGYHNFHHKFPTDYRNGIRSYHWDPTKWLVKTMSFFGQTYNLRQMPIERILMARLRMDQKRLLRKQETQQHAEFIEAARIKIEAAHTKFRELKAEYYRLKAERMNALHNQLAHLNDRIENLKNDVARARETLKGELSAWREMCGSYGVHSGWFKYN